MNPETVNAITTYTAVAMVFIALAVVSWLAFNNDEAAKGAIIGVVAAGVGFFLRGRVERPEGG